MSTNYAPYCKTCKVKSYIQDDRQLELSRVLIKHGPALKLVATAIDKIGKDHDGYWEPRFHVAGEGVCLDLDFWAHHGEHELVVRDEYGGFDGQCFHWVKCGLCGADHHCTLARGHEGPCEHRGTK